MAKLNRGGERAYAKALPVQLMGQERPELALPERHEADSVPRVRPGSNCCRPGDGRKGARPRRRGDSLLRDQHAKAASLGEGCKAEAKARQPHLLQECAMTRRTGYERWSKLKD